MRAAGFPRSVLQKPGSSNCDGSLSLLMFTSSTLNNRSHFFYSRPSVPNRCLWIAIKHQTNGQTNKHYNGKNKYIHSKKSYIASYYYFSCDGKIISKSTEPDSPDQSLHTHFSSDLHFCLRVKNMTLSDHYLTLANNRLEKQIYFFSLSSSSSAHRRKHHPSTCTKFASIKLRTANIKRSHHLPEIKKKKEKRASIIDPDSDESELSFVFGWRDVLVPKLVLTESDFY